VVHSTSCPYHFNPSLSEENWLLLRPSRFRQHESDFEDRGEYVLDFINKQDRNFQEALNQYRVLQLVDHVYQVGSGNNLLKFNFLDRVVKKSLRGGVHFRISRINIVDRASKKVKPNTKLRDVLGSLNQIFQQVIDEAKVEAKRGDVIQLVISTEKTPAYEGDSGMEYPISTPFFSIDDIAGKMIIPFLNRYFKKYEHITIGDQLIVETVLIRASHNMSHDEEEEILNGGMENVLDCVNILKRKKGVIRIQNTDKMCLTRAVVVCLFYNDWGKYNQFNEDGSENEEFQNAKQIYDSVRHGDSFSLKQYSYAKLLCEFSNVNPYAPTSNLDIEKVANFLNIEIKIVNFETLQVERKFGNPKNEKVYLLRRKIFTGTNPMDPTFFSKFIFHFDAIICMKTFLSENYYCIHCDVNFKHILGHKCKDKINSWCNACFRRECSNIEGKYQRCSSCSINTRDAECLENHKNLHICGSFWCCRCNRKFLKKRKSDGSFVSLIDSLSNHKCQIVCNLCGREKGQVHKCFMLRQEFKKPCKKLLFFDFETDQSSGVHLPVYCFLKWVEFSEDDETIVVEGEKEFGLNYLVSKQVGDFLFSEQFRGYTFIAHNMKGFDGFFLLRYLFQEGIHLTTIANGQKLNTVNVPSLDIRVIDSLNFLQMRLADLPSAIGVENIVKAKGYFPHFFTSPQTLNYVGIMPNPEFFGCQDMKDKGYEKFLEWYKKEKLKVFNFEESMRLYCKQDVLILEAACLKFRKLVMDVTRQIEPQPNQLDDEQRVETNRKFLRENKLIDPLVDDPFEGEISPKKVDCFDDTGVCDPFSYMSIPGMCSAIFKATFKKKKIDSTNFTCRI
jgi:hypothetical protein